jgi:hypothetical protein
MADHRTIITTMRAGTMFMASGCSWLSAIQGFRNDATTLGLLTLVGFGFGLCTSAATNMISVEVPIQHRGMRFLFCCPIEIFG